MLDLDFAKLSKHTHTLRELRERN